MDELEKKSIAKACANFINGQPPRSMKDQLLDLAAATNVDELTDTYGRGALIEDFETEIASVLGKPAALFLPSGTMAQLIALRIWCDRAGSRHIAMHATSHLALHEQDAYLHLHGMHATFLGEASRGLELRDFAALGGPGAGAGAGAGASATRIAAALMELPQRELGGVLPEWNELVSMSQFCRERGIRFHMDGARLWECAPFYQKSYSEISALFDSVYVSFYKGLGGITGAALAGPLDFIEEARIWQRRYGGNLYKLFPYVISARETFHARLPKMKAYHEKAAAIAAGLRALEDITVIPEMPPTNMMHLRFNRNADKLINAFYEIARETKIAGFFRLQPGTTPNTCQTELSIGDGALALDTTVVVETIREALSRSAR